MNQFNDSFKRFINEGTIECSEFSKTDAVEFAPEMAMLDHAEEWQMHPNACNAHVTTFINHLTGNPQDYSDYLDTKIVF